MTDRVVDEARVPGPVGEIPTPKPEPERAGTADSDVNVLSPEFLRGLQRLRKGGGY